MAQNIKNNGKGIIADHDRTEEEEIAQKSNKDKPYARLLDHKQLKQKQTSRGKCDGHVSVAITC